MNTGISRQYKAVLGLLLFFSLGFWIGGALQNTSRLIGWLVLLSGIGMGAVWYRKKLKRTDDDDAMTFPSLFSVLVQPVADAFQCVKDMTCAAFRVIGRPLPPLCWSLALTVVGVLGALGLFSMAFELFSKASDSSYYIQARILQVHAFYYLIGGIHVGVISWAVASLFSSVAITRQNIARIRFVKDCQVELNHESPQSTPPPVGHLPQGGMPESLIGWSIVCSILAFLSFALFGGLSIYLLAGGEKDAQTAGWLGLACSVCSFLWWKIWSGIFRAQSETAEAVYASAQRFADTCSDVFEAAKVAETATGEHRWTECVKGFFGFGTLGLFVLVFFGMAYYWHSAAQASATANAIPKLIADMVSIPERYYRIGKTEVTQAQWMAVMGDNPSEFKGAFLPVENVSWDDCQEFLKKFNELSEVKKSELVFRLPTEEEWEYACRADATGDYCKLENGTEITEDTLGKVAWYFGNSGGKTHSVGRKEANAFGLYDMHGNVREWTQTERRCGGGWDYSARDCKSSHGDGSWIISIRDPHDSSGFRLCAVDAKAEAEWKRTEAEREKAEAEREIAELLANMVSIPGKGYAYAIGKTEVTQAQWEAVMGNNPSSFKGADNPVENVSWNDCQEFLRKLNELPEVKNSGLVFRLPTDAEWEYACRAGATGKFCKLADGTEITEDTLGRVAWFKDNSEKETHPVGQKEPNAFGLYDMHGNVWEWCQNEIGEVWDYAKGKDYEHHRVNRGGSWLRSAGGCESSYRNRASPDYRLNYLGFRLCAEKR